ncbi:MAG: flavin reductase family protein [Candidatus Bathyarchaeia archaeon]
MKVSKEPEPLLYPCPVTLVTCTDPDGKPNIVTIAWIGMASSHPPMLTLGIDRERYSNKLILTTKEFVVNVPTVKLLRQTDFCGKFSGREVDKFAETGLTPEPAERVKPPLIKECPINLECVLREKIPVGSHDLMIGEIILVHIDGELLDEKGNIDFKKAAPFTYFHHNLEYWKVDTKIGDRGFAER